MKIQINNPKELKRIILRDDLWKHIVLFLLILASLFYYLKTNPKIITAQVTKIEITKNKQIIKYNYFDKTKLLKDSIINYFNNTKEKEVIEVFSSDIREGSEILLEISRLTNKPIKRTYKYTETSASKTEWLYYTIPFVFVAFIISIFVHLFRKRKNKYLIIMNGEIVPGKYQKTKKIPSEKYIHFYEYQIFNKKLIAKYTTTVDISYSNVQIIYERTNPEKTIIIEHQSKRLKEFLFLNNFKINKNNRPIKYQRFKRIYPDNKRIKKL